MILSDLTSSLGFATIGRDRRGFAPLGYARGLWRDMPVKPFHSDS